MKRTVTIWSEKGGVGKSSLAMNLLAVAYPDGCLIDLERNDCRQWALRGGKYHQRVAEAFDGARLSYLLHQAERNRWWTFINTPGRPVDGLVQSALDAASLVIIPLAPTQIDLTRTLSTIQAVQRTGRQYLLVLCRAMPLIQRRDARQTAAIREALLPYSEHLWNHQVSQSMLFDHATIAGLAVNDYGDRTPSREIASLFRRIQELCR